MTLSSFYSIYVIGSRDRKQQLRVVVIEKAVQRDSILAFALPPMRFDAVLGLGTKQLINRQTT
ncbi:MAG: hypothetical protein WDZ52_11500 [Pseudohongiellaceae bacterium]